MCTCGYTPFLDRSFTPESFNTLSRASSSWTTLRQASIQSPRTMRVVLDSSRRHVLNLLLALPWVLSLPIPVILLSLHLALSGWCSTLRVGTCSTFCWHFLGSSPPSLVILCHVSGCVSPHSRLLLLRSLPCSAFLAGTAHSVSEELCSTSCRHTSLYARGLGLFSGRRPFSSFLLLL